MTRPLGRAGISDRAPADGEPLSIREIGSRHVGGRVVTLAGMPERRRASAPGAALHAVDPNGEIVVGQLYVQYVRLAAPRSPHPLLMWHGGGMSGAAWKSTPDGRPGWQTAFLKAGFDVWISDAVERGRAGWAPYPDVYPEPPYFRTGREIWEESFRFGPAASWHADPARRHAHAGLRFPTACVERFMSQFVPRWATNDALIQSAYDALVGGLDSAILLTHSQGGYFGCNAALAAPERVKAVISLEPAAAPDPAHADARRLRGIPHLFVWGDYLDRHPIWVDAVPMVRRWMEALRAGGGTAEWIDLPALGLHGNSHALMADDNSDAIAGIVLGWLRRQGLVSAG
jgi:pimeloyl-ACP methyl ester carboxylesterase